MPTIDSRTQVSLYKAIERYGHLSGDRLDAEATAADIMRDFIVIPRSDLPEVTVSPGGRIQARGATLLHGTATGSDALGWLAIEEHLEKNPPIDEAAGVRAPQAGDDQ